MFFITAIGAANRQLLEQNARAMDQISANFRAFKVKFVLPFGIRHVSLLPPFCIKYMYHIYLNVWLISLNIDS